jgi:hypothetical protein
MYIDKKSEIEAFEYFKNEYSLQSGQIFDMTTGMDFYSFARFYESCKGSKENINTKVKQMINLWDKGRRLFTFKNHEFIVDEEVIEKERKKLEYLKKVRSSGFGKPCYCLENKKQYESRAEAGRDLGIMAYEIAKGIDEEKAIWSRELKQYVTIRDGNGKDLEKGYTETELVENEKKEEDLISEIEEIETKEEMILFEKHESKIVGAIRLSDISALYGQGNRLTIQVKNKSHKITMQNYNAEKVVLSFAKGEGCSVLVNEVWIESYTQESVKKEDLDERV